MIKNGAFLCAFICINVAGFFYKCNSLNNVFMIIIYICSLKDKKCIWIMVYFILVILYSKFIQRFVKPDQPYTHQRNDTMERTQCQ